MHFSVSSNQHNLSDLYTVEIQVKPKSAARTQEEALEQDVCNRTWSPLLEGEMPLPREELSTSKEAQACKSGAKSCSCKHIKVQHLGFSIKENTWCTGLSISGNEYCTVSTLSITRIQCILQSFMLPDRKHLNPLGKNALLKNYHLMAACGFGPIVPSGNWQPFWVRLALAWVTTEECSVVEGMTWK